MILLANVAAPSGRSLVELLTADGMPVRVLGQSVPGAGHPEPGQVATCGPFDARSLREALDGVSAVYLPPLAPTVVREFTRAARAAGVERIVVQSSGAVEEGITEQPTDADGRSADSARAEKTNGEGADEFAARWAQIEREVSASGLDWTILRMDVGAADPLRWAFDVVGQLLHRGRPTPQT
jgi:uncharacterized protein YbjT (DUF2867 family)